MWPIVMAVVGVVLGGALGVVATVFVFAALHLGLGSYEDVLPAMLLTLPAGSALGGFLGALLGRRLGRR